MEVVSAGLAVLRKQVINRFPQSAEIRLGHPIQSVGNNRLLGTAW